MKSSETHIAAIPTLYNGIQYRSRLEARFAEWLDAQKVDFQYEPGTVEGLGFNNYQPDFAVKWRNECNGHGGYQLHVNLYIEVKPKDLMQELDIFAEDQDEARVHGCRPQVGIEFSLHPWICVDMGSDRRWYINDYSWGFYSFGSGRIHTPVYFEFTESSDINLGGVIDLSAGWELAEEIEKESTLEVETPMTER
jgi:hypothetical protein